MTESRASHRYALALIGIAEELKKVDVVSADLAFIETLLKESSDFRSFLRSPVITSLKKRQVFGAVLTERVSDITMRFILLLTAKDREGLLPEIIRQFYELRDERAGILNVVARTVVDMTKEQQDELIRCIQDLTKKKVHLKLERDPSLIGGFTATYDDTVLDASVKRQLELLRERFAIS